MISPGIYRLSECCLPAPAGRYSGFRDHPPTAPSRDASQVSKIPVAFPERFGQCSGCLPLQRRVRPGFSPGSLPGCFLFSGAYNTGYQGAAARSDRAHKISMAPRHDLKNRFLAVLFGKINPAAPTLNSEKPTKTQEIVFYLKHLSETPVNLSRYSETVRGRPGPVCGQESVILTTTTVASSSNLSVP